jgi:hypothetical protein
MKDLKHLDFTPFAYGADRTIAYITVWNDDSCRYVEWIQTGLLRLNKMHDGSYQVNGEASKEISESGADPDGVYLFRFSVGGLQFENMFLNSTILTGWVNGGAPREFRVPHNTRVKRKGAPYVPAINAKLYNELRGRKIEIAIRTVFPKKET